MSYSHTATRQDEWVLENSCKPGYFVELGAYDGLRHSNTLLLEENGWWGTLIDGHSPHASQCRMNRPMCKTKHALIGDGSTASVIVGGQYTGIYNNMPETFQKEHIRRKNPAYMKKTVPLSQVIGIQRVDYLSLDTEGGEHDILHDWFEEGGSCRLLTVEFRYDLMELGRLEELCNKYFMELAEVRAFDACFMDTTV